MLVEFFLFSSNWTSCFYVSHMDSQIDVYRNLHTEQLNGSVNFLKIMWILHLQLIKISICQGFRLNLIPCINVFRWYAI